MHFSQGELIVKLIREITSEILHNFQYRQVSPVLHSIYLNNGRLYFSMIHTVYAHKIN